MSNEGLNKASYKSGWDTYETAIKSAYKTLGTLNATAAQITSAINDVNNARNALVRYAVVITNHYYYTDNTGEETVLLKKEYKMNANNNAVFTPSVLTNGQYVDYPFNRTNVVRSLTINVGDSTNYTKVIDQYYWYVDTAALEAAIAEQANRKHLDEEGNNLYTDDSWQAYVDAAVQAQRVLNDQTLFQASLDAEVKLLNAAKAGLKRLDIDTEWLAEGIQWASNIIDNAYEDDQGLDWDTNDLFNSTYSQQLYAQMVAAYNEAVEVTEDPDFTKSQADRVCALLWNAINNLCIKDETTKGLLIENKVRHADIEKYGYFKGLTDHLSESNGLLPVYEDILDNTKGSYRLNESAFTADSWYMLQDALYGDFAQGNFALASTEEPYEADNAIGELSVPAYSMINNIWFLASQADYNACRDNLISKVNNLEWDVDASALVGKYEEVVDTDFSLYTPASSARLSEDLEAVAEVLERLEEPQLYGDPDAITNDTVSDLVYELTEAVNALRLMPALEIPEAGIIAPQEGKEECINVGGEQTTAGQVLQAVSVLYNEDDAIVKLYNNKGRELALNSKVGTGTTLVLSLEDGTEIESYELVVKGDLTGNAETGAEDLNTVLNFAFTNQGLDEDSVYYLAGDLNGDGVVDLSDAIMLEEMMDA